MHEILLILVIAFVTFLTRVFPFIVFQKKTSPVIEYLGDVLPYAIMAMLVVYCLKDVQLFSSQHGICEIIGIGSVMLLHYYKGNTLLSVFGGTLIYMLCVQVLFL